MNQIVDDLNKTIIFENYNTFKLLSKIGKKLFFPKGILSQAGEAKNLANKINATIGIAKKYNKTIYLDSIMSNISPIKSEDSITYAPSFGLLSLRKSWKKALYKKNPSMKNKHISLPIVTCGITHAISTFADIWLDPEDVVIIPDMIWGNYKLILSIRKKVRLSKYPMFTSNGKFNIKEFSKKIIEESKNNKKITVLLNFPHNPSGYSLSKTEALEVVKILNDTAESGIKIIAACDDAYFGLFYEEETFKESLFSILCNINKNLLAVKFDGATKEDFAWGLRIGFITYGCLTKNENKSLYQAIEMKTAGSIRGTVSNVSHLNQTLILKSLNNKNSANEKLEKFKLLKTRAQTVKKILNNKKFFKVWKAYPFNSGYFICIKLKTVNAHQLRIHLLNKYGVGLISTEENVIRIAFSCIETTEIAELFEIVFQGIKDIASENKK